MKTVFSDFEGDSHVDYTVVVDIFETNMFGLNHDVKLIASDLTSSVDYVDNGLGSEPEFIYEQAP